MVILTSHLTGGVYIFEPFLSRCKRNLLRHRRKICANNVHTELHSLKKHYWQLWHIRFIFYTYSLKTLNQGIFVVTQFWQSIIVVYYICNNPPLLNPITSQLSANTPINNFINFVFIVSCNYLCTTFYFPSGTRL